MTTHIFVVDSTTFKIHLEKLFAGTGAKDYIIDFNNSTQTELNPTRERLLIGMTADACRIRKGDKILFYLQQDTTRHDEFNLAEGKFFGVFKAKEDWSFIDNNTDSQYLKKELNKSLTFRTLIEPDAVYPLGVTEWEALDEIKTIIHPYQMLWSLIYRKLRGNRGNTMITLYESQRLIQLLRDKNQRKILDPNKGLTFDEQEQKICYCESIYKYESLKEHICEYKGLKEQINILPRLLAKYKNKQAFEVHLQSFIAKAIGKGINKSLDKCFLLNNRKINWIGNEVGCGVGMQSIDIMLDLFENEQRILVPIELKSTILPNSICNQIKRYVDWISQYYKPNLICDICPAIICLKHKDKEFDKFNKNLKKLKDFNEQYKEISAPIQLIEFTINGDDIEFNNIEY